MSVSRNNFKQGDLMFVSRAASNLPQSTSTAYFTISADDPGLPAVEILQIVGVVGTSIQAQANATKLEHEFSGDLTAILDINGDTAAGNYFISQDPTTAMKHVTGGVPNFVSVCLVAGAIKLNCAASSTGTTRWTVYYRALQPGASIVTA